MAISGLGRGLEALGHEVRVFRPEGGEHPPSLLHRTGFNLHLRRTLRDERYDLVLGFDLDGFLLSSPRTSPYVVLLKGVAADEARFALFPHNLRLRLLGALEARNARNADQVVVPSRYSADVAASRYRLRREDIGVVPEGIDLEAWKLLRARPPPRADPRPSILSVARQYRRKNTRTLLEALPRVARAVPEVRLRVVGGGPCLPELKRQARKLGLETRVEFLGTVPDPEEVRKAYFTADVFCLPSLQEGFGIVFLEAMAAGLPVVAGKAGAVPEVVEDGRTGLLVDPRSPRSLAEALVRVLTDPPLRRRLSDEGTERVRRYDLPRVAERFLDVTAALRDGGPP